MNKLNIGCGNDYKEGWINLDRGQCRSDVKHDLHDVPLPFESNYFDHVLMQHILEHVRKSDFVDIVRDIYRICKPGATIDIRSPYAGSDNFWTDPTHEMPLTARTFDYFDETKPLGELGAIYGWNDIKFSVQGSAVDNPPNGPDVHYVLTVVK